MPLNVLVELVCDGCEKVGNGKIVSRHLTTKIGSAIPLSNNHHSSTKVIGPNGWNIQEKTGYITVICDDCVNADKTEEVVES